MRKYTFGELLYRFRIEKNVEAQQICWGLCTSPMMTLYESGECTPDTLMFMCMVERMAISPEDFSIMVSKEEYVYHEWKEKVCKEIENANWDEVGTLLKSKVITKTYCNEKIEKQFYLYASAIYFASKEDYRIAYILLEEAIKLTMPDISELKNDRIMLSVQELHILILYLYYGVKGKQINLDVGKELFDVLEKYISGDCLEINDKTKCYPKLVCIGRNCFKSEIADSEMMELCEKAIQILRQGKDFFDITELLRIYIPLLEKYNSNQLNFYKKHYEVFCDLLESEGMSIEFQPELFTIAKPKVYIISEYLYSRRKAVGLTQVKLSEGICEPETYSRIENGKRAPSKKNFKALAERLDINWCYYGGELDTLNPLAFELRSRQRHINTEGDRYEGLEILTQLETALDMTLVVNKQYVKCSEYINKCRLGLMNPKEVYDKLEELLQLTQKMDSDTSQLVYYTQTELEIIGCMAQTLRRQKRFDEGIQLIETVLKQMNHSKVGFENQWNGFSFLFRIYSGLHFYIGNYEKSFEIASYVKTCMIKRRDAANLPEVLDELADDLEHMGEQHRKAYMKLYRYTYYVGDFFYIDKVIDFAKKTYESKIASDVVWY